MPCYYLVSLHLSLSFITILFCRYLFILPRSNLKVTCSTLSNWSGAILFGSYLENLIISKVHRFCGTVQQSSWQPAVGTSTLGSVRKELVLERLGFGLPSFWFCLCGCIVKILNLYIILLCTHLSHFFPVSLKVFFLGF